MSAPVDVLAVMLRAEAGREWDMNKAAAGGDMSAASSAEEECRQMREARAAVVELIEAAKHAREALVESKSDPLTVGKLTRAIARVGGAS